MPCQGDNSEVCGGSLRLDLYTSSPAWVPLGCFYDKPWARTLAVGGTYDGSLTVEKCLATCGASGYRYAGLEWVYPCIATFSMREIKLTFPTSLVSSMLLWKFTQQWRRAYARQRRVLQHDLLRTDL